MRVKEAECQWNLNWRVEKWIWCNFKQVFESVTSNSFKNIQGHSAITKCIPIFSLENHMNFSFVVSINLFSFGGVEAAKSHGLKINENKIKKNFTNFLLPSSFQLLQEFFLPNQPLKHEFFLQFLMSTEVVSESDFGDLFRRIWIDCEIYGLRDISIWSSN